MSLDSTKNFAKATVSTLYDAAATSIVLSTGHGAKLPTAPFNVVWWNSSDYADPSDDPNVEIVRVTIVSTDTLTVTRAQESTSASTKNTAGKTYKMIAGLTAKVMNTDLAANFLPNSGLATISGASAGLNIQPDASTAGSIAVYTQNTQTQGGSAVYMLSGNNNTYPAANNTLGTIEFRNLAWGLSAFVRGYASQQHTASATGGFLMVGTTANGTTTSTERMRIDQNGNVNIGAAASPGNKLCVTSTASIDGVAITSLDRASLWFNVTNGSSYNWLIQNAVGGSGDLQFLASTTAGGTPTTSVMTMLSTGKVGIGMTPTHQLELSTDSAAKPTSSTWTIVSDTRLKTNIKPFTDGLKVVKALDPITYDYNGKGNMPTGVSGIGLIAQDAQPHIPYAIGSHKAKLSPDDTEETDILNLSCHALPFILINAVKELSQQVEVLTQEIKVLEAKQ